MNKQINKYDYLRGKKEKNIIIIIMIIIIKIFI